MPLSVLLDGELDQAACLQARDRSPERHLNDTRMSSDLDRARDRGPVLHLRHRELEQLGGSRKAVVRGAVQIRPGPDDRNRERFLELAYAVAATERKRAHPFFFRERSGEERQVLADREQERTIDP